MAQAGLIDKLFARFGRHLEAEGYIARGGQIIDATIVPVPKQRNTKEENEAIKAGKTPEEWEKQPAKNAQKDKDARWTNKNPLGVDETHKLIRKWDATDAAVHDSQKPDDVLELSNTGKGVWGQHLPLGLDRGGPEGEGLAEPYPPARFTQSSAVRAPEVSEYDARRCAPVSSMSSASSRTRWTARLRTIGIMRARFKIGMMNLVYNMRRLVQLDGSRLHPLELSRWVESV